MYPCNTVTIVTYIYILSVFSNRKTRTISSKYVTFFQGIISTVTSFPFREPCCCVNMAIRNILFPLKWCHAKRQYFRRSYSIDYKAYTNPILYK